MLMWIIEHVPSWFVLLLLVTSGFGVAVGTFGGSLPFVSDYAKIIKQVGYVGLVLAVWLAGAVFTASGWRERIAEAERKAEQIHVESTATNQVLQAELLLRDQQLKEKQRARTEYVTKVVTKYDSRCDVPNAVVGLLSSAAENGVPPSPTDLDGTTSDVKISDIVQNTSDNYATCYQIRDKLIAWQEWYARQKTIYEKSR